MNRSLFIALLYISLGAHASEDLATCIFNSTVINVADGERQSGQHVILQGNRIAEVTSEPFDKSKCSTRIDAAGKFLVPGLWDMHVHGTGRPALWPIFIAHGVTGVRDLFGRPDIRQFRSSLAGSKVKPRVVTAGPIIDGPPGLWPGSDVVSNAAEGRNVVARQAAAGVDFLKVYQLLSRDAYFAILDEAAKRNLPVAGHIPSMVTASEASHAGHASIEHLSDVAVSCASDEASLRANLPRSFYASRQRVVKAEASFDEAKCREFAQIMLKNGTWMVPTFAVMDGESQQHDPVSVEQRARYFDADTRGWLVPETEQYSDEQRAILRQAMKVEMSLALFLHKEGVPVLAGSDGINPYTFPGFALHDELALLVEAGFSPLAALQAATINAARFLKMEADYGAVEAGKLADLVLLDADPLASIENTKQIRAVFSDGRHFDRQALDSLLQSATQQ